MTPQQLMEKATRAVESAKLLLDAGDLDGACNRAYYAMFDAAQAALIWSDSSGESTVIKTHSGLISAFGLNLVKTGRIPIDLGRAFNRVAELRLVADYTGNEVLIENVQWAIEQADKFVEVVQRILDPA